MTENISYDNIKIIVLKHIQESYEAGLRKILKEKKMIKNGARVSFVLKGHGKDETVIGVVNNYLGDNRYYVVEEKKGTGYYGVKLEEIIILDSNEEFSEPKMGLD